MKIANRNILLTGANRGLGRTLLTAFLQHGARHVYAGARNTNALASLVAASAGRVSAVPLDVTRPGEIEQLASSLPDVSMVVNNAGSLASFSVMSDSTASIRQDMETNFFGPLLVARSFAPLLERSGEGVLVNVLTVAALASMPAIGGYSASKAAAYSLTQALRSELRPRGIRVVAVFPGPVDTDMIRSFAVTKTAADVVAGAIVEGIESGCDDIAPDPMSREVYDLWRTDPKSIETRFGAR